MNRLSAKLIRFATSKGAFITLSAGLLIGLVVPAYAISSSAYEQRQYTHPNTGNVGIIRNSIYTQAWPWHDYATSAGAMILTYDGSGIESIGSRSRATEYCIGVPGTQRWDSGWNWGYNSSWSHTSGATTSKGWCFSDTEFEIRHFSYGDWYDRVKFTPYMQNSFYLRCNIGLTPYCY